MQYPGTVILDLKDAQNMPQAESGPVTSTMIITTKCYREECQSNYSQNRTLVKQRLRVRLNAAVSEWVSIYAVCLFSMTRQVLFGQV